MTRDTILANATLVLPNETLRGQVRLVDGRIADIAEARSVPPGAEDCAGDLVMAWLVIPIIRNFQTPDSQMTKYLPVAVVAVFVFRGIGSYISEYGMAWTGHRVVFDLRLVEHLLFDALLRCDFANVLERIVHGGRCIFGGVDKHRCKQEANHCQCHVRETHFRLNFDHNLSF